MPENTILCFPDNKGMNEAQVIPLILILETASYIREYLESMTFDVGRTTLLFPPGEWLMKKNYVEETIGPTEPAVAEILFPVICDFNHTLLVVK
jgi:hypothetical protein